MTSSARKYFLAIAVVAILMFITTRIKWTHSDSDGIAYPHLSSQVIDGVKSFVLFVGYGRSGHSIIGSLMDAHPHVVIADEFYLFSKFHQLDKVKDDAWKGNLFNRLYQKSVEDLHGRRAESDKGYTLLVDGLWQGRFDEHIEAIGDKSGGRTTRAYLEDREAFERNYKNLQEKLSMSFRIIHAMRNPFDIISAKVNYGLTNTSQYQKIKSSHQSSALSSIQMLKASDEAILNVTRDVFRWAGAVVEMIEDVIGRENVLEIHNCDLVRNPKYVFSTIFQFLDMDVSNQYLDACAGKIFKSVSRSRDTLEWSPKLRNTVEEQMRKYEMFNRYSFTSVC